MSDWYITGNRWQLCKIVRYSFGGVVMVRLYTGEEATGRARPGLYGYLVDSVT